MSNQGKRWTKEDNVGLLNELFRGITLPIDKKDASFLNKTYKRKLNPKSWNERIRKVQNRYYTIFDFANTLNDKLNGASVDVNGADSIKITSDHAAPCCENCKHWHFLHHRTDEHHEVFITIGDCRIRSVDNDCFPERESDEHCGEHDRNNAL